MNNNVVPQKSYDETAPFKTSDDETLNYSLQNLTLKLNTINRRMAKKGYTPMVYGQKRRFAAFLILHDIRYNCCVSFFGPKP